MHPSPSSPKGRIGKNLGLVLTWPCGSCGFATHTRCAVDLIHGPLPHLRVLALCGEIGDEFLKELAGVSLPSLEDLDVRNTNITPEAVRAFALGKRPGLSSLKRLGIAFDSDRRQDYTDSNGALVGWGYEPMTDLELQYDILSGSGLLLMPTIYGRPKLGVRASARCPGNRRADRAPRVGSGNLIWHRYPQGRTRTSSAPKALSPAIDGHLDLRAVQNPSSNRRVSPRN